jgi:tetratricopeptide (TPR) repeat protein
MKRLATAGGLLLAFVLLGGEARAQTGTARGKVVDAEGKPIEGVVVTLEFTGGVNRKYETKTNKKGEYTQVGVYPGTYKVTVAKEGYQGSFLDTRINLGEPTYLPDFKLQTAAAAAKAGGAAPGGAAEMQAAFEKATTLARDGKTDESIAAYQEFIGKYPTIPEAYFNIGLMYKQKQDWANAEASFKKALELRPGYSDASLNLARVYEQSGQKEKAQELMANAGAGDPKVQFQIGLDQFHAGKYEAALETLTKTEAQDPNNAEIQYYLGTIALNMGKTDEAVKRLEKYLSMNPTNAQNKATAEGLVQALKPKK